MLYPSHNNAEVAVKPGSNPRHKVLVTLRKENEFRFFIAAIAFLVLSIAEGWGYGFAFLAGGLIWSFRLEN